MLSVDNVHVAYGQSSVVNGLSLKIDRKQKVCLMGRNGVGKTTLLKSIMGILPTRKGTITFEQSNITKQKTFKRSRMGLAYVPQGRDIIPMLTVLENIELGSMAHYHKEKQQLVEEMLEYFPALKEHLHRKGGVLSGGQQQQLAIARALMSKPKVLFLDEPSEGIQPNVVAEIATILNRVHEEKELSILIVEQNLDFAFKIANQFYIMEKGEVVKEGAADKLSKDEIKGYLTI